MIDIQVRGLALSWLCKRGVATLTQITRHKTWFEVIDSFSAFGRNRSERCECHSMLWELSLVKVTIRSVPLLL